MRNKILFFIITVFLTGVANFSYGQNAWINEIHYDNVDTDENESVEVVIENPENYTLNNFLVTFYNGSNGTSYTTTTLDNFTVGSTVGNYTIFSFHPSSIQNGAPDGIALSYDGTLIAGQFLSYEGNFTATNGVANGVESTDIGVSEGGTTSIGQSLQLSGTGTGYSDFTWQAPATATVGSVNTGQIIPVAAPTLAVTPSTLTGFTYEDGSGPSTEQTFVLSGTDMNSTNVVLTPPVNYEISKTTGTGFVASPSTLTYTAYSGADETVYVRLKAGLSVNTYNGEIIAIAGGGDTDGATVSPLDGTVTSAPSNDTDSEVYEGTEIDAANISSLADTEAEAVNVLKFTIEDAGAPGDELATIVTNIKIKPHSTNTAYWTDNIQGIKLNNGSDITLGTVDITDNYIDIAIPTGNLSITNSTSQEVTLSVYLNNSGLKDNGILSFMVDADNHGFTTDASGSSFISVFSLEDFNSKDFTIDVEATEMQFVQQPSNVSTNENITPAVTVAFTDANGNIELDLETADVSMTATGATLGGTVEAAIDASGIATFSTLQFSTVANGVTITATDKDGYLNANIESSTFDVTEILPTLFISEYIEGSSNNKAIEIYNPTGSDVDLGDYKIWKISNGGSWPETSLTLSGTLAAGDVYTIVYNSAVDSLKNKADLKEASVTTFNGDDAVGLVYQGTLIDAIGTDGAAPSSAWDVAGTENATVNHTLVRKSNVTCGNTDWAASAGTNTSDSEWEVKSEDEFDYFGWHIETTWNGTWSNGSPLPANNAFVNANYTVATNLTCNELSIVGANTFTVNSGVTVTLNSDLTNEGTILLKSANSNAPTGALITLGTVTNTGTMTAERFLTTPNTIPVLQTDEGNWHLIGSPLTTAVAVEEVLLNDYAYEYVTSSDSWSALAFQADNINPGQGYLVQTVQPSGKKLEFTGAFNTGDVTKNLSNAGTGWNLVTNPYPSAIDLDALSLTDVDVNFYTYDPDNCGDASQEYSVWDGAVQAHSGSRYIQSMQGFFVHSTSASSSITFTDANRVSNDVAGNFLKTTVSDLLRINVSKEDGYSEAIIYFANNESKTPKINGMGVDALNLYVLEDEKPYVIRRFAEMEDDKTVALGFECSVSGQYTFNVSEFTFSNSTIFLEDLITGDMTELNATSSYVFTHDATNSEARFKLHFNLSVTEIESLDESNTNVYSYNKSIYVNFETATKANISVYDIAGRLVCEKQSNNDENIIEMNANEGIYLVKIKTNEGVITRKVFVK